MAGKCKDYLSKDEEAMLLAIVVSLRSKDPNNRVGAVIVDKEYRIISTGYNGLTLGMDDNMFDWTSSGEKTNDFMKIKDYFVVHAERNAILNYIRKGGKSLEDCTLYVTWFPCVECAKEIIQSGIKKVVYLRMYSKKEMVNICRSLFKKAGVDVIEYKNRNTNKEEILQIEGTIKKLVKEKL